MQRLIARLCIIEESQPVKNRNLIFSHTDINMYELDTTSVSVPTISCVSFPDRSTGSFATKYNPSTFSPHL
jgi:hypothetical protein